MSSLRLVISSLKHYWRTNLAIGLGIIVSTAVIGGALIVGDSVRDSLRDMTLKRLGKIDYVLQSPRFFREKLADQLQENQHRFTSGGFRFAPAIWLSGSVETRGTESLRRVANANVVGLEDDGWKLLETGAAKLPAEREVVLGARVAADLGVSVGDELSLWVEIPESVPRETLLGERDEVAQEVAVTVSRILSDSDGASRLDLRPGQQLPMTIYVNLGFLQEQLGLEEVRRSRRNPLGRPARINTVLLGAEGRAIASAEATQALIAQVNGLVQSQLRPADLGLRVRPDKERGYLSFESDSLILDDGVADAAEEVRLQMEGRAPLANVFPYSQWNPSDDVAPITTTQTKNKFSSVLVYLANQIANARDDTGGDAVARECFSSYSVIAGIELENTSPFGPFQYADKPVTKLADDEILINEWLAEDIQVNVGDDVRVRYFIVGSEGEGQDGGLKETSALFKVAGVVKLSDPANPDALTPAADPGFTPHVPGITDADSISDWEQPFEMDMDRITERDDEYWEEHKSTPKAFVSLSVAQKLFGSRHGNISSLRVALAPGIDAEDAAKLARQRVLPKPSAAELGLGFRPVKQEGLRASVGANDFTGLFVGFSFFLIAAAAILIGLLFRLSIDRRTSDIGILSTIGVTEPKVRRLFLGEGLILILLSVIPGLLAAVAYAGLMMYGLRTWWIGATGTRFLHLSVRPTSLIIAALAAIVIAVLVIFLSVRRVRNYSAKQLLTGATDQRSIGSGVTWMSKFTFIGGLVVGFGLLAATLSGLIPNVEAFAGFTWHVVLFFVLAISLLVAGIAGLGLWLASGKSRPIRPGVAAMSRLGLRNASRHRARSLFTIGLIAFATFVIVAVGAGRRNPSAETADFTSGNGGFTLVAETSQPVLHPITTDDGLDKLDLANQLPDGVSFQQFRVKDGEDGSCLNLYQTRLPTVLGVSDSMIERGGFRFADTKSEAPWQLIGKAGAVESLTWKQDSFDMMTGKPVVLDKLADVPVYPVLGDMNTLQYSLKKGIGDYIPVPPEGEPEYAFKVVGMLDSSVFQGVLLVSEKNFVQAYPDEPGHRYFLVETPEDQIDEVSTVLETQLTQYGLDAERVNDRIAGFLSVQNTYLSTFQTLGGLGLLLGTLGLGTVMLRNIIERRSELALMRAVGFAPGKLRWVVLAENAMLLLLGLGLGTSCALLAMIPHLLKTGADVPWLSLGLVIGGVFVVGMLAALFATREAIRTPVLATLRGD